MISRACYYDNRSVVDKLIKPMPRPTKEQQTAIKLRNKDIYEMSKKYPPEYLVTHFNLDKTTISRIIKKEKNNN